MSQQHENDDGGRGPGGIENEEQPALEEIDAGGEKCKINTDEEINFQQERENVTWDAAVQFLDAFTEEADDVISSKEKEMYARQALLKGWNQQVLKKARVLLAGAGMVGRELAKDLALIGIGHLTLVDPRRVGANAPARFLLPPVPGPASKAGTVKEQLAHLNPFMTVDVVDSTIEELPLKTLKDHDIVVACMNAFKSRVYAHEACKRLGVPYAEGTVLGMEGFVQAWVPGDPGVDDDPGMFETAYADEMEPAAGSSNPAVASIIAGVLGQEIIKIAFKVKGGDIGDVQVPRYIHYDGRTGLFDPNVDRKDLLLVRGRSPGLDSALLAGTTVFIAGVGALGCEIAKDLALAGVGKLVLVDLDTIETSNLSRQLLFRMGDIGKPKAEVAALRVKELNPSMEVEYHFTKIQSLPLDLYEKCDVIIAALDNVQARFDLNVIARRVKRPMIEGGTVGFEGHVQVVVPAGARFLEETACYRCVVPVPPPDQKLIAACTPKGIPQVREHCVLRAEWIFRKKEEREPDLKNKRDVVLLTGASNQELVMLKERDPSADHGGPFVPQDMENILENKIPAIQTVSSVIASIESVEAMKMAAIQHATGKPGDVTIMDPTYMNYNGMWGIVDHLPVLKREECPVCGIQKGIEYVQIPVTAESAVGDVFASLETVGTITAEQKFMITNPQTKGIIYHPSIPSFGDKARRLSDFGLGPGTDILLTPFGMPKSEDGSEPTKLQVTLVSVS